MRRLVMIALLVVVGCQSSRSPEPFRQRVEGLVEEEQYLEAAKYLAALDPAAEAKADAADGSPDYLAVSGITILTPGLAPGEVGPRDAWIFPGTGDVLTEPGQVEWQTAANNFARVYNETMRRLQP